MELNITITNKIAVADGIVVNDNNDYTVVFSFDSEWDDIQTKTARFVYKDSYTDVVFTGNSVAMPQLTDTDLILVGVFGGSLHTTTPAAFRVVQSILGSDGTPAEPTPSVYQQIMARLNEVENEIPTKVSELENDSGYLVEDDLTSLETQVANNTNNISTLQHQYSDVAYYEAQDRANIATNTSAIASHEQTINAHSTTIANNTLAIAQNKADIATNKSNIATNATNIAQNKVDIQYNTDSIAVNTSNIISQGVDLAKVIRSNHLLWELNEGISYDYESQEESGTNNPPSGAEAYAVADVYGKSEQDSTNGYQLANFVSASITNDYGTITVDNNKITINVNNTSDSTVLFNFRNTLNVDLETGTYTASCSNEKTTSDGIAVSLYSWDWSQAFVLNTSLSTTVSIESATFGLAIYIGKGVSVNKSFYYMLESGSTAHSYEPYTNGASPNPEYPQKIVDVEEENFTIVGKNLFDKDSVSLNSALDLTTGELLNGWNGYYVSDFIPVKSGATYVIPSTGSSRRCFYNKDKSFNSTATATLYTPTDDGYIRVTGVSTTLPIDDLQIERGSTATDYEPYSSVNYTMNYTLRSVGTVRDKLFLEYDDEGNELCGIERNVGNGDLGNYAYTYNSTYNLFVTSSINEYAQQGLELMCEKFIPKTSSIGSLENGQMRKADNLYLKDTDYTSTTDFKNAMVGTKIIYRLINPTTESISTADQSFLESLQELSSDHTITIVDQNGNDISYLVEYIISLREAE